MNTLVVAHNPLQRSTWKEYQGDNFGELLLKVAPQFGGHFPQNAKIYHEKITQQHDVTPATPEAAEALRRLKGTLYVMNWPATGEPITTGLLVNAALFVAATIVKALFLKDEQVTSRQLPKGSPNNLPGDRQNQARVMQRIPDIYGTVKSTPDLLQYPYIHYVNNLQVETTYACIGRGYYDVEEEEIFEGQTPVISIPGSSVEIYPPGEVPGTGTPQLTVGNDISDPLYTVVVCKEVTGEVLIPPNTTFIAGDEDWTDEAKENADGFLDLWFNQTLAPAYGSGFAPAPLFSTSAPGIGLIFFDYTGVKCVRFLGGEEITTQFEVGDKLGLDWKGRVPPDLFASESERHKSWGGASVHFFTLVEGVETEIPDLSLLPSTADDEHYEILDINFSTPLPTGFVETVTLAVAIPESKQAEWDKIANFNVGGHGTEEDGYAQAGFMYNRCFLLYKLNYVQGPFFINDQHMEELHLNFVAERGLWIDDGNKQYQYGAFGQLSGETTIQDNYGVGVTIEVTPADELGAAIGPKELFEHVLEGSAVRRDFIGVTAIITPSFTGRCLVSCYRNTVQYLRRELPSFRDPRNEDEARTWGRRTKNVFIPQDAGGQPEDGRVNYRAMSMQYEDEVKWTHLYSMSAPKYTGDVGQLEDLGGVTTVHCRTSQLRNTVPRNVEKRLNMIVTRKGLVFSSGEFLEDPLLPTQRGIDALFAVLLDPKLGNVPEANIDFVGIGEAFDAVEEGLGGQLATGFSHTFDAESASLEDMLTAIAESCFITLYRQGNIIKARADVSAADASLIFNHRNKYPGTENWSVSFANEEEYDGVEIEYTDLEDDQLKIYGVPVAGTLRNPRKIRVAGVKSRAKAAMHAWRAYNRLLYQNTTVEFDACEEAALGLVRDKVLISRGISSAETDMNDGDIIGIDGLTVYTSQPVDLSGPGDYTLFIQNVDNTVQAIPVVTGGDTANSMIIDGVPSGDLIINPDQGLFPRYILGRDLETTPKAFHIVETTYKNRGSYGVTATNYTEGYYFNDAVRLFIPFESTQGFPPIRLFDDRSPFEEEWEDTGAISVVTDPTTPSRGSVCEVFDASSFVDYPDPLITSGSYTIALWLYRTNSDEMSLFKSMSGNELIFGVDGTTDAYTLTHNSVDYVTGGSTNTLNTWEHVAVTYDSDTEVARIYRNGVQDATAVDVPEYLGFDGIRILSGLIGRADDLYFFRVLKSAEFIRELYLKTRKA